MVISQVINDYFYARASFYASSFLSAWCSTENFPGLPDIDEVTNCIANIAFEVITMWEVLTFNYHSQTLLKLFLNASAIFVAASKIKSCDYFVCV